LNFAIRAVASGKLKEKSYNYLDNDRKRKVASSKRMLKLKKLDRELDVGAGLVFVRL